MNLKTIFFLLIFTNLYSQDRNQFIKWGVSLHYTSPTDKRIDDYINPSIYFDVALKENDIFDASSLYLQPYMEIWLRNDKAFKPVSAGINLKRFFATGNSKGNFYLFGGGKLTFNRLYSSEYTLDFGYNLGMGITLNRQFELTGYYSQGFTNSYLNDNRNLVKIKSFSIGINYFFQRNWWFN